MDEKVLERLAEVRARYEAHFQALSGTVFEDELADLLDERRSYIPAGAEVADLDVLLQHCEWSLSAQYLAFLRASNGLLGVLFDVASVVRRNDPDRREQVAPRTVIGGDGGPHLYLLTPEGRVEQIAKIGDPDRVFASWPCFDDWFLATFSAAC